MPDDVQDPQTQQDAWVFWSNPPVVDLPEGVFTKIDENASGQATDQTTEEQVSLWSDELSASVTDEPLPDFWSLDGAVQEDLPKVEDAPFVWVEDLNQNVSDSVVASDDALGFSDAISSLNQEDWDTSQGIFAEVPSIDLENNDVATELNNEVVAEVNDEVNTEVKEEVKEEVPVVEAVDLPSVENSDLQQKFNELYQSVQSVYEIQGLSEEQPFEVVGSDNDKIKVNYSFQVMNSEHTLLTIRKETDIQTQDQQQTQLKFVLNDQEKSLLVYLNDQLLFDEKEDLQEDSKKKMQVVDKLNKLSFLVSEYYSKLEKEHTERQEQEEEDAKKKAEKKAMYDSFRNF